MAMMALRTPAELGGGPQLGAVSGGVMPPINYERYIETMASYLPEITAAEENQRMQREALQMQRDEIARQRRDANIALGIKGTQTAFELGTNPTVQKWGMKVWNAIQPKPPQMPVTNMAPVNYMQSGAGTSGGSFQPGTFQTQSMNAITPSYTPEPPTPLTSAVPAEFEVIGSAPLSEGTAFPTASQPSTMSRIGGFKGIDVPGGALAKMGIGAGANLLINESNFGNYMSKKIGGGKQEWKDAASLGTSALLGGPLGLGIGLAGIGIREFGKKNCIIVSSATHPNSREVEIAREFRDKFCDKTILRGYYFYGEPLVELMEQYPEVKEYVKVTLVDPLIRFAAFKLNHSKEHPSIQDCAVVKGYMDLWRNIGSTMKEFVRNNGEKV